MTFESDGSPGASTMSPGDLLSDYQDIKRPIDHSKVTARIPSPVDFSQVNINLDPNVALLQASKHQEEENELKKIVDGFHANVTGFVADLLKHDDDILNRSNHLESQLKAQILRSELDRQKIEESKNRIAELTGQLESSRLAEFKANARVNELQETASKLTEWNSQLEDKCRRLESEKEELVEINLKVQKELEAQILEISDKSISLARQYAEQEEKLLSLQRSVTELREIEEKLEQENAILKSKLYNLTVKTNEKDPKISQTTLQASSSSFQKLSDPFQPDLMDEIKLTAEQRTITDIFKASFPS